MEDKIGIIVTSTVGGICPLYLYEAETAEYPYAVYSYVPEFRSTKDGVYRITADLTMDIYSDDFDEAHALALEVRDALVALGGVFRCREISNSMECVEGVWDIRWTYRVDQTGEYQPEENDQNS